MKNLSVPRVLILLLLSTVCNAKTITVLSIDTGADVMSHEELRKHVLMSEWQKDAYTDFNGHGTHIAGIILKDTCDEVQFTSCKYYGTDKPLSDNAEVDCFKTALVKHYDIINFSSGGTIFIQAEYDTIKALKNTLIIAAVGNDNKDLSIWHFYPASYDLPNVVAVGNLNGIYKEPSSSFGLKNMVWEEGTKILSTWPGGRFGRMTGTSQATASYSNKLLKKMCAKQ
jgi:subtilisin family serine protease